MKEVVLASGNMNKLSEMQERLGKYFRLRSQAEWNIGVVAETGQTFIENALIKARHCAVATGLPALADDSGLSVPALDGAPGIYSARYAGETASDAENTEKLLAKMAKLKAEERCAMFHCTLIFCRYADDPDPLCAQGCWLGHITHEPTGSGGFGYDPVFIPDGETVTVACLPAEVKHSISHRGRALDALLAQLNTWL